jgi:hypothetical protein
MFILRHEFHSVFGGYAVIVPVIGLTSARETGESSVHRGKVTKIRPFEVTVTPLI